MVVFLGFEHLVVNQTTTKHPIWYLFEKSDLSVVFKTITPLRVLWSGVISVKKILRAQMP